MLEIINLDFDYNDEPLLNKVNFRLPAGGLMHLSGANGTGKTTLLKVMAGLYQPSQGQIQFCNQPITQNLTDYQRQLCFVGHKTGINPYLTVRENCLFDLHFRAEHGNLQDLASVFKLDHQLDKLCGLLSAGQRRQVGLLRLWMTDARLWLLDEPLVALDEVAVAVLMNHLDNHRKQGGAIALTSHQKLPLTTSDYMEYKL